MRSSTFLVIIWSVMTIILYKFYINNVHHQRDMKNEIAEHYNEIEVFQKKLHNQNIILNQKSTRHAIEQAIQKNNIVGLQEINPNNIIVTQNE